MRSPHPHDCDVTALDRRHFLNSCASGAGFLALASLLQRDGLLAADGPSPAAAAPTATTPPHFRPRAKNCIFLLQAGAASHLDLFDPKPKLRELHGQPLPESMTDGVRFAFIQKGSAVLMGSPFEFHRHGDCGMELSELLPAIGAQADDIALIRSMHTDAFNHHPAQLMITSGVPTFGRPTLGSWLAYGLGSESDDLPAYVVLTAGRGASGGASNWSSGFLPSSYEGVVLRNAGDPILNLSSPPGVGPGDQRRALDAIGALNRAHRADMGDHEIDSRIAAYELAFRMQASAPSLTDLSDEPDSVLEEYGVGRTTDGFQAYGYDGSRDFHTYARNCLLARRMVERGVRFVNLIHASWDHHENLTTGLRFSAKMCDQPVAALIRDLKRRGLLDETLIVFATEFGRTPLGENRVGRPANTGRDHHPFAFSIFLAGAGVRGGTVVGATDDIGWNVVDQPVHVNDLHATILRLFGLDHERLTYRHQGRDFRLTDVAGRVVTAALA